MSSETSISVKEFATKIRGYNCFALIRSLGGIPRHFLEADASHEDMARINPWVIAGLIRESLVRSNPNRGKSEIAPNEILILSNLYQNIYEQGPAGIPFDAHIYAKASIEQFTHQESEFEEIARFLLIYGGSQSKEEKVVNESFKKSFGMSVKDFANISVVMYAFALLNGGHIPIMPSSDTDISTFVDDYNLDVYQKYLWRLSADRSSFTSNLPVDRKYLGSTNLKYRPNPLFDYPIIKLSAEEYIAPLPRLVLRKCTHAYVYQGCFDVSGEEYSSAVGVIFENYLGRQLDLLTDKFLYEAIKWTEAKDSLESSDWIVVTREYVVIVESKSAKLPWLSTQGETELFDYARERVAESLIQINRTYQQIVSGNPEFAHIPKHLPILGIVATAESLRVANLPYIREGMNCDVPFLTMSFREIEHSVPEDANNWAGTLYRIAIDPDRKHWNVNSALPKGFGGERNEILDAAADSLRVFANSVIKTNSPHLPQANTSN